jgi:hypothetical protein
MELDIKNRKLIADASAKADQLAIERERILSQEKIAGMNAQIKVLSEDKSRQAKAEEMGAKLGIDMAKSKEQFNLQRMQRQQQKQPPKKDDNK